ALPATGQETAATEQQPATDPAAIDQAPPDPSAFDEAPTDQAPAEPPATDQTAAQQGALGQVYEMPNPATSKAAPQPLQSLVVMVDGEPRSWAPLEKGTDIAWQAYQRGEFPRAVPTFARLAKLGHPVAEWLMGNIYFFGQGIPKDYGKSRAMFEASA